MSVIPERPASADSAERAHRAYLKEIDYNQSIMNGQALRRKSTIMMQKTLSAEKPHHKDTDPIAERGDEEDEAVKNQNSLTLPIAKKGLAGTQSNLNLMEGNLSARDEEFEGAMLYKPVEC